MTHSPCTKIVLRGAFFGRHPAYTAPSAILTKIRLTLEMIKFEHSVFALPFALTGALLAIREGGPRPAAGWKLCGS